MRISKVQVAKIGILLLGVILLLAAGASAASKEKVIHSFQGGSDGAYPSSSLVADAAGNLYGTTAGGGNACQGYGCGTVFELRKTKSGWQHKVIHNFAGYPNDGSNPNLLILGSDGNLYGSTGCLGGASGIIFQLSPTPHGWTEQILYTDCASSLVFDNLGNLFAAKERGGCCGYIYELIHQVNGTWTEKTIYQFTGRSDGSYPVAITFDTSGNLVGSSSNRRYARWNCSETGGCGTIFELTPGSGGTWNFSILYQFARGGGSGIYPVSLMAEENGDLTGTSFQGGDGFGTVFKLHNTQKNGWQPTNLHLFYGNPDGVYPTGNLLRRSNGHLAGVTYNGGINNVGIVFDLMLYEGRWHEQVLHSFGSTGDGSYPAEGLLEQNGKLYGTTVSGGNTTLCSGGCGTVYEIIQ